MKKLFVALLLIFVLCAFAPVCAFAADSRNETVYSPDGKGYTLATVTEKGTKYLRFSGYYFGDSGIAVVAELYPDDNLDLDFNINAANLTTKQQQTRNEVIELFDAVDAFINKVDLCANTYFDGTQGLPTSDIIAYNNAAFGTKLQISKETYEMLTIAREMYEVTNGAFNPAVYRLVDLWGFSSRIYSRFLWGMQPYDREGNVSFDLAGLHLDAYPLPEQKYIDAFSADSFLDFSQQAVTLLVEEDNYFVTKNVQPVTVDGHSYEQWLDLGGIAKGYVVDGINSMFASKGFQRFFVDAGSSSNAYGKFFNDAQHSFLLRDTTETAVLLLGWEIDPSSISTSGQYIRKYVTDGVEYAHILDGSTGAPAQTGVASVTVVVPQSQGFWAAKSDCLTTALTVMGKDNVVQFINGYLKEHNIDVVVVYNSLDGHKQILSNLNKEQITHRGPTFDQCDWALNQDDNGNFVYVAPQPQAKSYQTVIIVLASIVGVCVVALVVYHFVKGKKRALQNVQHARKDKPFKYADVGIYLAVVLLIVVLFGVFFGGDKANPATIQTITVTDMTNEETLFCYNVLRNEYETNSQNAGGWTIEVSTEGNTITVTCAKVVNGEQHFNTLKIVRGNTTTVQMVDSLCGRHKDCVKTFGVVKLPSAAIVCSPNLLKVITE